MATTEPKTLTCDGRERRYLVHYPPQYNAAIAWPLVLSFHGSNSNAQIQLEFTAMNETADREGFIIVYPFGTGQRWSGTRRAPPATRPARACRPRRGPAAT